MLAGLVLVAACGGGGGGDDDHDAAAPDARVIDAVPEFDAPDLDAAPGVTHTLFVNFAGGTLHPGFDGSANDTSSILSTTSNLSAFSQPGLEAAIVADVAAALAPYNIDVVTVRPTAGLYTMVMVGGTGPQVGQPAGTLAVAPATCTARDNMIAFVFDGDTNVHDDAWEAIAVFGLVHAIPISSLAGDCMCFAEAACLNAPLAQTCTIGGADTPMSSQEQCETIAPFDEAARFLNAFGAHP
jgi:hypothetical protein